MLHPLLILSLILILTLTLSLSQAPVSVQWIQSLRIDTGNRLLVSNHLSTTTTFTFSAPYHTNKTWSAIPSVLLSIRQMRIASNAGSIQFESKIQGNPTMVDFVNIVTIVAPTQIWYLQTRYLAYDGGFNMFNTQFWMTFKKFSPLIINTGTGPRNQDLSTTLTSTSPRSNKILATFTTGLKSTISTAYLQANITQKLVGNTFIINVKVHSDTQIFSLSCYFIMIDLDLLEIRDWIFAQHFVTTAYNGAQNTWYHPSVLYQTNYISGLRSFSMVNNLNFNFTISGLVFTTYNDSLYNDVTHLNFWVRYCPTPYLYYNKVDQKCYQICPTQTYPIQPDTLCSACSPTCATCSTPTNCLTCPANRILNPTSTACVCIDYYYQYQGSCLSCHYSCQKCVHSGQYFNCQKCDTAMFRTLNSGVCQCIAGYTDVGVVMCQENCGDGVVLGAQCDDNNLDNGDGCSSQCMFQQYFTCDLPAPPATPKSLCYFIGDIVVDVVRIEKNPDANQVSIYLKVQPFVTAFNRLTAENMYTNISTASFLSYQVLNGLLVYNISYDSDFQGQTVNFGLKRSSSPTDMFSRFFPKNDTFVAQANNGLLLKSYLKGDYTQALIYKQTSLVLGYIFLAFSFIFCFGEWKQLGLQMLFSLQICFFTYAVLPYFNPIITSSLKINHILGWNEINGKILPPYHKIPVLQHMGYSVGFDHNFNIMAIMPSLCLILYIIYRLMLFRHERRRKQKDNAQDFQDTYIGKITTHFQFDLFVYWMLANMQQVLIATAIQVNDLTNPLIFAFVAISLLGVVISILALFVKPKSMTVYRQKLFHKSYGGGTFLMVLISTLIMDIIILVSTLINKYIFYATLLCPVTLTMYTMARQPFKTGWNNIRLIIMQLGILVVIILQIVTLNLTYDQTKSYNIGILAIMSVIFIVTFVSWVCDVVKKIHKLRSENDYEDSQQESKKEEESINEKVREAGFALVYGNRSRLQTGMQVSNIPSSRKHLQKSCQPQKLSSSKIEKIKPLRKLESRDPPTLRQRQKQERDDEFVTNDEKNKGKQSSTIKSYNQLKREDTEEKEKTDRRRNKANPYAEIIKQSSFLK